MRIYHPVLTTSANVKSEIIAMLRMSMFCFMLCACSAQMPNDLELISFRKVQSEGELERSEYSQYVISRSEVRHLLKNAWLVEKDKSLLRIEMRTMQEVYNYPDEYNYTVGMSVQICDEENFNTLIVDPSVYYNNDVYVGYIPIEVIETHSRENVNDHRSYDLRSGNKDICVKLRGGSVVGSFYSNTIRISANDIKNEIR